MSFDNYRGVRISLISRSDIRYEGVLDDVNPETSTIGLINVRSFGTEGRKANPREEVGPQNKVFPYICFRASDVKDLQVLEQKDDAPPPDPAIIDYQPPTSDVPSLPVQSSASSTHPVNINGSSRTQRRASRSRSPPRNDHLRSNQNSGHHHRGPRTGPHRLGRGSGRPLGPIIPKGEFNFDESNAKLDKEALAREFGQLNISEDINDNTVEQSNTGKNVVIPPSEVFYDKKSSFFDNISCESQDRAERGSMDYQQRRQRMYQERRTNLETFGVSSSGSRFNRGGRGGRGRGASHGDSQGGMRGGNRG